MRKTGRWVLPLVLMFLVTLTTVLWAGNHRAEKRLDDLRALHAGGGGGGGIKVFVLKGVQFLSLPGGSFTMGNVRGDKSEKPEHSVTVRDFGLSKAEVSVEQYERCVSDNSCQKPKEKKDNFYCNWGYSRRKDHPINCVTHSQAADFCRWVGGSLPTEAQWEYAAKGGQNDAKHPWGDHSANCSYGVFNVDGVGCDNRSTDTVCDEEYKDRTRHGLCDMGGNIAEWVADGWHADYSGAPGDDRVWSGGSGHVVRGGNFYEKPVDATTTIRQNGDEMRYYLIGFRCAAPTQD